MAESTESIPAQVFLDKEAALKHGPGAIWYKYKDVPNPRFPEDIASVWIVMPVIVDEDCSNSHICCEWTINHRNHCNAQWSLSGTHDKPTLSPSLHWVGMWHGFLQNGFLKSC